MCLLRQEFSLSQTSFAPPHAIQRILAASNTWHEVLRKALCRLLVLAPFNPFHSHQTPLDVINLQLSLPFMPSRLWRLGACSTQKGLASNPLARPSRGMWQELDCQKIISQSRFILKTPGVDLGSEQRTAERQPTRHHGHNKLTDEPISSQHDIGSANLEAHADCKHVSIAG